MYFFGEKNGVGIVIKKVQDYEFLCNTSGNARGGGGGTPINYLYGYMPPKGVLILKLLI